MLETKYDPHHPAAAPQLRCRICHRWIAKNRSPCVLRYDSDDPVPMHLPCMDKPTPQKAHARWYPDCPEPWHDMWDHHDHIFGTRAGVASALGIWP